MKKIKLSDAARLISFSSEHFISAEALRKMIKKGLWPFWAKKIDGDWYVYLEDCLQYATNFKGFRIGRPLKITTPGARSMTKPGG